MATFDQITEMEKLVQTLARLDLPSELEGEHDAVETALGDADCLYNLIEQARDILRHKES